MRKIFSIAILAFTAVLASVSCTEKIQEEQPDILVLSPSAKSVISAGAEIQVGIRANYAVSASCKESWIHLAMEEKSCTVSVDENFDLNVRKAEVIFTTEKGCKAVFELTQFSAQADEVTVSQKEMTLTADRGEFEVRVVSTYEYNVECDADWVEIAADGMKVTLSVEALEESFPRSATIRFVSVRGASDELTITQIPNDFIAIDRTEVTVDHKANTVDIAVTAYYAVSVQPSETWVSVESKGDNMYAVKVEANTIEESRSATVVFSTELGASATLKINQDAADIITANVKTRSVSPDSDNFDVTVKSVYAYTHSCDVDWVHITALGDDKYHIVVDDNRVSRDARVATVKFTSERGAEATVVITQAGFFDEVKLSLGQIEADEYGARVEVTVETNYPVTPSVDQAWLSVLGSGTTFTVCVARNETSEARTGHVTFTSNHGASASLKVTQTTSQGTGGGTTLPFIDIEDINFD